MNLRYSKLFVTICFLFVYSFAFSQKQDISAREVMDKCLKSIKEIKGLKYHLKIIERGKKGMNYYESSVKFNRNPRLIYLYTKGIEVLWRQGENNGNTLVKTNFFPYINLNLDPMGNLMRQDQHHTLHDMGYDYFASIIQHVKDKVGDQFDEVFELEGSERINGRPCYKINIHCNDFAYMDYTVQENESITSIARKFFVAEYMIVEKNPKFKDYFDILKKGQVIKVPNWYAKTVTVYIDQFYFVPVSFKVIDDKGLFEEYNYHFLQVNPTFAPEEFTRTYKDYGF